MNLRAAILSRVSVVQAENGHSLEMQQRRGQEIVEENGWEFVGHYEGNGERAFLKPLDERPSTALLLQDVKAGRIDVVVAWSSDRTQRDVDSESLYAALKRYGVLLFDVVDGWQNDSIQSVVTRFGRRLAGHLESAQKRERMRAIALKRAEDGLPTGTVSFGYERRSHDVSVPDQRCADALREAARRALQGQGSGEIAAWLNAEGHRTVRGYGSRPGQCATCCAAASSSVKSCTTAAATAASMSPSWTSRHSRRYSSGKGSGGVHEGSTRGSRPASTASSGAAAAAAASSPIACADVLASGSGTVATARQMAAPAWRRRLKRR